MYAMCCATVVAYASYCCRLFGRVFGPPQRLTAPAKRVLLIKADSSLLIFSELGSYKPLNWMTAPCTIREIDPAAKSAQHSRESVAGGAVMVILRRIPRKVSPLVSRKRCYVSAPTRVRTFLK